MAPASELARIARRPDGALAIGTGPGRGAWVCEGSPACFEAATRRGALTRALRQPVTDQEIEELREKLFRGERHRFR